ncbi:MAG: hypothetical protein DMF76_19320 [Acidobacteria bacterium]|nr:MAG: hypothetical protein DMF76_19320 [Acidobacteriota bacterium]
MKNIFRTFHLAALYFCLSVGVTAQTNTSPRGITPEDYFSFEFVSDANVSPDGRLVSYVVTKIDRAQNRRNSSIWMAATDGRSRAPWQFTTSPQSSNSPRWSPDGKWLASGRADSGGGRGCSTFRSVAQSGLSAGDERRRSEANYQSEEWRQRISLVAGWNSSGGRQSHRSI